MESERKTFRSAMHYIANRATCGWYDEGGEALERGRKHADDEKHTVHVDGVRSTTFTYDANWSKA